LLFCGCSVPSRISTVGHVGPAHVPVEVRHHRRQQLGRGLPRGKQQLPNSCTVRGRTLDSCGAPFCANASDHAARSSIRSSAQVITGMPGLLGTVTITSAVAARRPSTVLSVREQLSARAFVMCGPRCHSAACSAAALRQDRHGTGKGARCMRP
jgi:hypothetical protein